LVGNEIAGARLWRMAVSLMMGATITASLPITGSEVWVVLSIK
jgi:hypothetical protein